MKTWTREELLDPGNEERLKADILLSAYFRFCVTSKLFPRSECGDFSIYEDLVLGRKYAFGYPVDFNKPDLYRMRISLLNSGDKGNEEIYYQLTYLGELTSEGRSFSGFIEVDDANLYTSEDEVYPLVYEEISGRLKTILGSAVERAKYVNQLYENLETRKTIRP